MKAEKQNSFLFVKILTVIIFLFFSPQFCHPQFLTIYHNDLAYFQETKTFQLSSGKQWIWLKDFSETADLNSLVLFPITQKAIKIYEQRVIQPYDKSQTFLVKSLHKEIELVITEDTNLRGVLEDIAPDVLMVKDNRGSIHLVNRTMIKRIIAANDSSVTSNEARAGWLIESPSALNAQFSISYFLSGLSWKTDYRAIYLDKIHRLILLPRASVKNNSRKQITAEQLWLIAGDVRRNNTDLPSISRGSLQKSVFSAMAASVEDVVHEEKYEYHSYRLPGPVTIEPQSEISKTLIEEKDVPIRKKYVFDGERFGNSVHVQFTLKNTAEEGMGTALPEGQITLYQLDENQKLTFLIEDNFPATPEGKEVSFSGGITFDFVGERIRSYFRNISTNTVEEGYEIRLRNASSRGDTVYVVENLRGEWKILQSSYSFKQRNSQSVEFIVPIAKKSEAVLTYSVKIS